MGKRIEIAPSILSADFCHLGREVEHVAQSGADRIHCDVMDGVFVSTITFGPAVVAAVGGCVGIPLDVHLMITDPIRLVDAFCDAGADTLIVHAEACPDVPAVIRKIRDKGVRPGLTVDPDKSLDLILPHLDAVDQVLIMTVYAGRGGQTFIPEMLEKITAIAAACGKTGRDIDIEVDGGVNAETAALCCQAGANVLVAGSYIFKAEHYTQAIATLREAGKRASGLP
jgi:ribulose-phosphate 3-epimerase